MGASSALYGWLSCSQTVNGKLHCIENQWIWTLAGYYCSKRYITLIFDSVTQGRVLYNIQSKFWQNRLLRKVPLLVSFLDLTKRLNILFFNSLLHPNWSRHVAPYRHHLTAQLKTKHSRFERGLFERGPRLSRCPQRQPADRPQHPTTSSSSVVDSSHPVSPGQTLAGTILWSKQLTRDDGPHDAEGIAA